MSEICKICMMRRFEWETDELKGHIINDHIEEPESVQEVYPNISENVDFDQSSDKNDKNESDIGEEIFQSQTSQSNTDDNTYGKKWYLIGVGGAGNNIIDSILLRRDTLLDKNKPRSRIWEGGIAGIGSLNTNITEIEQTYYAQEEMEYSRNDLLPNTIIGMGEHDYAGAGYRWDFGQALMYKDFGENKDPFNERWDMRKQDIKDSQAVMFLHSVTKGTGCGSTPVLAEEMRQSVLESDDRFLSKPLFSGVVIPSKGGQYSEFGGRAKVNGVVGLAKISKQVDAIIPFNNNRLDEVEAEIQPDIHRIEDYIPPQYQHLNKPLIGFLEAFTMSSIPQFLDREATMNIMGDVFDPADSFRPVQDKYNHNPDRNFTPAVVLAPVLGRSRANQINENKIELLIRNTLFQNKLADFDPNTAWGGTFLLYGPEEKMNQVSSFVSDGRVNEILSKEEFLNASRSGGVGSIDIHIKQLVVPYLNDIYLWGTLWNPKMPALEEMFDHADRIKQEGNTEQAENLRNNWDTVETLFSSLGRENMG